MPRAPVKASAKLSAVNGDGTATITLTNTTNHIAFFIRAEIIQGPSGNEILPITYSDNYVTLFSHEARTIVANFQVSLLSGAVPSLRLEGNNIDKQVLPLR